ncbi:TP901 family phage tail tape measure protein [Hoeflea halophila]|uniref:TP901 family phage tail tape measure protein n=1 Tax=Hoeflea halophila TaxID=714899 RepID=A0A286IFD9_9HYPH|nr:phage tail tape measure protein [Hoeflea halophila]SOE18838.1 TP901 family phage tail tape measure protein [Hoeflea halophila]
MTKFTAAIKLTATDSTLAAFRSVAQSASGLHGTLARFETGAARFAHKTAAASAAAAGTIVAASRDLITYEKNLAGAIKKLGYDEARAGQAELRKEIQATGKDLGTLSAIYSQALTSGVDAVDALPFTVLAAKTATAMDMSAEESANSLAKIRSAYGLTIAEVQRYADEVNYAADAEATTAARVIEANARAAAYSKGANFDTTALTAINTQMTVAVEPEVAATALKNATLALQAGQTATKSQIAAYRQLGLDAEKVQKAMMVDGDRTYMEVLKKVAELPKELQQTTLTQLFGKEGVAAHLAVLNDLEKVAEREKKLREGGAAGSIDKEVASVNATMSQRLTNSINSVRAAGASLAEAFTPAIEKFAELTGRAADFFNGLSEGQRQWSAFAVLGVAALSPVGFALSGIAAATRTVTTGFAVLAPVAARVGVALRGAMVGFAMLSSAGGIGAALAAVGTAAAAAAAPIAAIVTGVALLAIGAGAIIRRRGPISDFFASIWHSITSGFSSAVSAVSDFAGQIAAEVGSIASKAAEALGDWAYDLVTMIVPPEVLDGVIAKATELGTNIVEGVKAAFTGIKDWFANLFGGIFDAIMGEVVANLKAVAELIPAWARPAALDDWLNADAANAAAPEAKAAASIAPTIPAADLPAINGGIPAPATAAAVVAQPTAPVASGPSGAEAAMTAIAASIDARAASIEAALSKGGIVRVDTSVRVSGGQVTGSKTSASGVARAGDTGVQELGSD